MQGMNLTEIPVEKIEVYIDHEHWWMQQKLDGTRALVKIDRRAQNIEFYARNGQPLKHTAAMQHFEALTEALSPLLLKSPQGLGGFEEAWLDAELLIREGTLHVFDLPALWGEETNFLDSATYGLRQFWLSEVLGNLDREGPVKWVRTAKTAEAKRELLVRASATGVEGVVVRAKGSRYQPGVRAKDVLKVKFVKTADVVVLDCTRARNEAGRETGSFLFGIFDPENPKADELGYVTFGACSAIGKPHAERGDVIEVAYLYREPGGGLVQPRMVRVRNDKPATDCRFDQFPVYSREVI